jgi:hypothetical protein
MTAPAQSNQTSSLMLTLSIGLQLLAFFVVLNATAIPDAARTQAVVASVQQSFNPYALDVALGNKTETKKIAAQTALRSSISDAFNRVLNGRDVVVRNDGEVLWVKAPMAAFFEPETRLLRAVLPVLDRISAVLESPPEGLRYEMLITISDIDGADGQSALQAGVLAEDLLRRGFKPSSFSIGAVAATERAIILTFVVLADDEQPLGTLIGGQQL